MLRFYDGSYVRNLDAGKKLANDTGVHPDDIKTDFSYKSENTKFKLYEVYSHYYEDKYAVCKANLQCTTCDDQTGADCVFRKYSPIKIVNSDDSFSVLVVNIFLLLISLLLLI